MPLSDIIHEAEEVIAWLDGRIDGVSIPSTFRGRSAGGSLDVALEHQKAIILLVEHSLYGSAFALVRVLFEAYVRGVWLHQCASEQDLHDFKREKLARTFQSLLDDIEQLDAFSSGVLSSIKKTSWGLMNSLTHTGFSQVVSRNSSATIEPQYEKADILQAISFATAIGLMCAVEIAHLGNNDALANELLEKAKAVANEF